MSIICIILYYNARSLLPKLDNLILAIDIFKPHIICIVETWLSSEITDCKISIPGFQLFRYDRNRHGGGVFAYVSNMFSVTVLPSPTPLEALTLCNFCNNFKVHLCLFYRPPSSASIVFDNFCTYLDSIQAGRLSNFVLLGDFNVNYDNMSHPLYFNLCSIASLYCLTQVVTGPTHEHHNGYTSTIDLVFLPRLSQHQNRVVTQSPPLSNSDHMGISLKLKKKPMKSEQTEGRLIWRYSYADWEKACRCLSLGFAIVP